jgi:hypothetical protein
MCCGSDSCTHDSYELDRWEGRIQQLPFPFICGRDSCTAAHDSYELGQEGGQNTTASLSLVWQGQLYSCPRQL